MRAPRSLPLALLILREAMTNHSSLITHRSSVPFYVTGGTLSRDAQSYVMRQADDDLYAGLAQGSFCYVLTSRQMGKSSLMVRTAARLREAGAGVVLLDLTAIGQNLTAEQWYNGLLTQIGQQLELDDELEEFWDAHPKLGPLQRWMQAIRRVLLPRYPGAVVIFVDEIDAVRSLPFSTDEFFAAIREFYNRRTEDEELRRLTFCLLGVAAPSDLIRDTRTTPFNVGRRIELSDFTEAEAAPLVEGLRQSAATGLLKRILYWTNGHPYLTQRLCQAVAEGAKESTADEVDRLCRELFLTHQAQERDDNLLFVRERLLRSEVDLAGLLTLYAGALARKRVPDDLTSPLVTTLRLSGVTRAEDGLLKVRNRIYERVFGREWVKENMPDAELRRQREAYRRGLLRAAAVAGGILAIIAALAFAALTQRNRAKAEATRADQNFQQANRNAGEARGNQSEAERQRQIADEQRQAALNQQQIAEEQRDLAREQELSNRRLLYAAQMNLAGQAWEDAGITRMTELLQNQIPKPGQPAQEDLRGFEWNYLWNLGASELRSFRHGQFITSVNFFPDNKRLVTAGADRVVRVWDIVAGQQLMALSGHSDVVDSVAVSRDGQILASGSEDRTVKIWNALTGREVAMLKGHTAGVVSIAFSPDGKRLATASDDKSVRLWDLAAERELATLAHPDKVSRLAFSPDGKMLATGCWDSVARLWDAISGKQLHALKGHGFPIYALAFSPEGATLATGSGDYRVLFWDVATGQAVTVSRPDNQQPVPKTIRGGGAIVSLSFSPGGETIAVASFDRTVKLYSAANLQLLKTFKGHGLSVNDVAFSPNGKLLVSGGHDGVAKLWDPAVAQEAVFMPGDAQVWGLSFSPDGCCLATVGRSRVAKLWEVTSQKEMRSFKGHTDTIRGVAFSPDGRRLASASHDKTARLWNVTTGEELMRFIGHTAPITSVVFSPDGRRLATASEDKTARLWNTLNGQEIISFKGHAAKVVRLAFSPNGRRLATASSDATVKLWDVVTLREIATLKHIMPVLSVAFSPDGGSLATTCEDGLVRLWNLSTGKESLTLKGHHSPPEFLAFFPDGRRLATGSGDNTVKLWDIETRQELLSVRHIGSQITGLTVSADGAMLASAASNRVKLWLAGDPASAAKAKIERLRELTLARKTP